MPAYYNEIDPCAAQWLRNLISAGHIAPGDVDERSILDVRSDDLRGYTQCHFFAGIGVWSYALRQAGWSDDRPVWTGSCPCQPFSAAGKGDEFADERHLWPAWFRLIGESRPVAVFGEQVSSKDALAWLDHVCFDLESAGYAVGAIDTCAASVGAPHIRQRLSFVADAGCGSVRGGRSAMGRTPSGSESEGDQRAQIKSDRYGAANSIMVNAIDARLEGHAGHGDDRDESGRIGAHAIGSTRAASATRATRTLDHAADPRRQGTWEHDGGQPLLAARSVEPGPTNGFWRNAIWLPCRDGKARAIEPGIEPLVNGAPARVGRLRAYGNCIVAPQAQAFIKSYMEIE